MVTVSVLTAFVIYSTWAAFIGKDHYAWGDAARNLISPSALRREQLRPGGSHTFGTLPPGTARRRR